jgi:hypothetical protein
MKTKGYVEDYPCLCSGGDMCYIVRHPKVEQIPPSYPTKQEAKQKLRELNED